MFSDVFDGDQHKVGNNISLTLISGDQQALEDAFHKLEIGGTSQRSVTTDILDWPVRFRYRSVRHRLAGKP